MNKKNILHLEIAIIALLFLSTKTYLMGGETEYPMPEAFNRSLIIGKTLRNPYASKLRASQASVKDIVQGNSAKLEQTLKERFLVTTVLFFSSGSPLNRVLINDTVRRPGDELTGAEEENGDVKSVHLLKIEKKAILLEVSDSSGQKQAVLLPTDSNKQI